MLIHDFGDGDGPVAAHKHSNGGGWVADTAHVSADAYVGCNALVFGEAQVSGNAQVYGEAWVSRTPITLYGLEHTVQVFDNLVAVGCELHPLSVWENAEFSPKSCPRLESLRAALVELAHEHQKVVAKAGA